MSSGVICTMKDIRSCKLCSEGARRFFKRNNLDWGDFLANGIPEEKLIATGDANAMRVVEAARGRQK